MTLKEWLKENQGKRVKIGSGGGYFYCDTITTKTFKQLKKIDDYYIDFYYRNLMANNKKVVNENLNEKQRKNAKKTVLNLKSKLKNYQPLSKRKVLETYDSIQIDEVGVVIVRVEGDENGKYWTMKEFEFDKVRKEMGYKYAKKTVRLRLPPLREFQHIRK